jgi:hypothetical protein
MTKLIWINKHALKLPVPNKQIRIFYENKNKKYYPEKNKLNYNLYNIFIF